MFNPNVQLTPAQILLFEQNALASLQTIQHLKMTMGLPVLGQYLQAFNMNPNMGGVPQQTPNFTQHQQYNQQTNPVSWIIDIRTCANVDDLRITQTTQGVVNPSTKVLSRLDFIQYISNSGTTGQDLVRHLAATAQYQTQLFGWILTDNQTLLTMPGVGSALFDTDFVKALPNCKVTDIRPIEKTSTKKVVVQWITDIQTTSVGGDFKVTFNKLRDTSTPNSYTTDFDSYTEAKTLSRVGLLELDSSELVSLQIATLVESGVNGKVLCVWCLDDDHVLVSLKAIGAAVFSLGILQCLDDTVEIIDLRPEARAAKIQVQPTTTEETDLSMNDIRAMAEEQVNTQPEVPQYNRHDSFNQALSSAGYFYDPKNKRDKLATLNIDNVEFKGTAKTAYHQKYKFTFQHPTTRKLEVGVTPEQLEEFLTTEFDPITNRGLSIFIGKQNKLTTNKTVFTFVTFQNSDNAIVQLVSDTTRTCVMSKFDLARIADKIIDDTYVRQIYVG